MRLWFAYKMWAAVEQIRDAVESCAYVVFYSNSIQNIVYTYSGRFTVYNLNNFLLVIFSIPIVYRNLILQNTQAKQRRAGDFLRIWQLGQRNRD